MKNTHNIWFFSDPHYAHKNIVRGVSEWTDKEKCRDFDTVEEMNYKLISSLNKHIQYNDVAYCLGDWSFSGAENIAKFREQLNCENIHLIFGNHDGHITPIDSEYRKLFTSCEYYKELHFGKSSAKMICLFHYALRIWNKRNKDSIALYGHSHGNLPEGSDRSMDVGVDTNADYKPYSLEEVFHIMDKRVNNTVDHHIKM